MAARWKKPLLISLIVILSVVIGVGLRPARHLWQAHQHDVARSLVSRPGMANDVSGLNPTAMLTIAVVPDSAAAVQQLRNLLVYARGHTLPVTIAGAQHSMGGHTLAAGGLRLDMRPFNKLHLDTVSTLLTVGGGACWDEIIPYLNRYGRAVATMQSDNAFSVGGSLSVNCHGWQPNQPPIAATVESVQVLLADGRLLQCSRSENQELFRLVLGGYGLFGIILEARLRTVPNDIYAYHRVDSPAADYLLAYRRYIDANPRVHLAYGRLNVTPKHFLEEATLNYFETKQPAARHQTLPEPSLQSLKRAVFIGSKADAYGKQLRWDLEQAFSQAQVGDEFSRNEIMNESPALYLNRTPGQTDILHEYFIPARHFNAFRLALQRHARHYQADLLNVTLRNVYADSDTFLPYAREEVFGFVLFFNQAVTPTAEANMVALTQKLIAEAEHLGGTYYMPYRLHATPAQLRKAYPQFPEFIRLKRKYDPDELFQNQFYQRYKVLAAPAKQSAQTSLLKPRNQPQVNQPLRQIARH